MPHISLRAVCQELTPPISPTTRVDEVLDNVDTDTRQFLLKSALLRSMNDALIVRVTGEENGQMRPGGDRAPGAVLATYG